jgi:hypothetical protein
MAVQLGGPVRRLRAPVGSRSRGGTRHPLVALAMALPCGVLLAVLFGGWHQMVVRARSLADLIGR